MPAKRGANIVGYIVAALTLIMTAVSAEAGRRVALVIGNQEYAQLPSLEKAIADADGYADYLKEKQFDFVLYRNNLTQRQMDLAIAEFADVIEPGDTAVFVYAGHGWSDGVTNYLVGTDAPRSINESALARISTPLQNGANGVLDEIAKKGAAVKVAIVDACRDNPFQSNLAGRSIGVTRGLSVQEPPRGTFIVYSAGSNQTALDRLSETDPAPQSVFTRTFLPLLQADLPLLDAVKQTQVKVYELARMISHNQEPAYYDQIRGSVCLSQNCRVVMPATVQPAPSGQGDTMAAAFEAASRIDTIAGWDAFLSGCADSIYCGIAEAAREKLMSETTSVVAREPDRVDTAATAPDAWRVPSAAPGRVEDGATPQRTGSPTAAQVDPEIDDRPQELAAVSPGNEEFVRSTAPGGADADRSTASPHSPDPGSGGEASAPSSDLPGAEEALWAEAAAAQSVETVQAYLDAYPDGRFADAAQQRLAALVAADEARKRLEMLQRQEEERQAWRGVSGTRRPADLEAFLETFPSGRYAPEAREQLAALKEAEAERRAWGKVANSNSIDDVRGFLEAYPRGFYATAARRRLADLEAAAKETAHWERVAGSEDEDKLQSYLRAYPRGRFAAEAERQLAIVRDRERERGLWERTVSSNSITEYRFYLQAYPQGAYIAEARKRLAALEEEQRELEMWRRASTTYNVAEIQAYIEAFPHGRFVEAAKQRIAVLEAALKEERLWRSVDGSQNVDDLKSYLRAYPSGRYAAAAQRQIAAIDERQKEIDLWRRVAGSDSISEVQAYLTAYPRGRFAGAARRQLAALEDARREELHWRRVSTSDSIGEVRSYVEAYPAGRHINEAHARIAALRKTENRRIAREREEQLWQAAASGDRGRVQAYLDAYPSGSHAAAARQRLTELAEAASRQRRIEEEDSLWAAAKASGDIAAVRRYLEQFPGGRYAASAAQQLRTLQSEQAKQQRLAAEEAAWRRVAQSSDLAAVTAFLEQYPDGTHASEANARVASLKTADAERRDQERENNVWARVKDSDNKDDIEYYLDFYPNGRFVEEARKRIALLEEAEDLQEVQIASRTPPEAQIPDRRAQEPEDVVPELSGRPLIVALQTMLKDAGCYRMRIDGAWGRGSQGGLEQFVDELDLESRPAPTFELLQEARAKTYDTPVCDEVRQPPRSQQASTNPGSSRASKPAPARSRATRPSRTRRATTQPSRPSKPAQVERRRPKVVAQPPAAAAPPVQRRRPLVLP